MDLKLAKFDPKDCQEFFFRRISFITGPLEMCQLIKNGEKLTIVDVRAAEDYAEGHVPGAISIPEEKWDDTSKLHRNTVNIIYGYSDTSMLASRAAFFFATKGFQVMEMEGGWDGWKAYKLDIERGSENVEKTIKTHVA